MKRILTTFLIALFGCLALMAESYSPKTVPNPRDVDAHAYVCNPDSILSAEEVKKLESICTKIDSLSEVELAVVAIKDIGDANAYDFALDLFNTWGIGNKEKNTGVLLFLATGPRKVQIITGDGIEGILPDGECSLTIDEMIDDLRNDNFGAGLITGAKSIGTKVTTMEARTELLLDNHLPEPSGAPWSWLAWLTGLGGAGYIGSYYLKKKCPQCGERELKVTQDKILKQATRKSQGQGQRTYTCKKCGHVFTEQYVIPMLPPPTSSSGGSSSGGFSSGGSSWGGGSFGGGHSSGGGAGRSF